MGVNELGPETLPIRQNPIEDSRTKSYFFDCLDRAQLFCPPPPKGQIRALHTAAPNIWKPIPPAIPPDWIESSCSVFAQGAPSQ